MHSLFSEPSRRLFLLRTVVPIFLLAIAVTALAASLLYWATREADHASIDRQHRLVQFVVSQLQSRIAHDQESVTVWDDAVVAVRGGNTPEWIDLNLGSWMNTYFGHDGAYVLDPRDRAIFAFSEGVTAEGTSAYELLRPTTAPLVDALRERMLAGGDEGLTDKILSPGVADLAVVSGRPAVVSVKPIVSDSGDIEQQPGEEYVHVAVRYLDEDFITELKRDYLLDGLRFAWQDDAAANEASAPLISSLGDTIGYFIWQPYRPGAAVLSKVAPAVLALFLITMAALGGFVSLLRKRSLKLSQSEATVRHLAHHDMLTGLPNRAQFDGRLKRALQPVRGPGESVAVLYLDLDRFKEVNDTFGHPAGDELLREFADRLRRLTRETDTVARIGGDEFLILLPGVSSPDGVEEFCQRLIETARHPFDLSSTQVFVGVSVGVALAPQDGLDPVELMRRADVAMYHAKRLGRSEFAIYADEMDSDINARRDIERDLRKALETPGQLSVHYQPLFAAGDFRIAGVEALVRWRHPERGWIPPSVFIPVAEESGLIEKLGEWVLHEACTTARDWPVDTVAVNVSAFELYNPAFAVRVANTLLSTGMNPKKLELEVTESALSDSHGACERNIAAVRDLGVRFSLDDFGTGFSSLSRLHDFTVDRIKIDRSFVAGFGKANGDEAIVQAIVDLARAIGLKTTAEGVETGPQSDFLRSIGCDELQGFLLSMPLPAGEVERLWTQTEAKRAAT